MRRVCVRVDEGGPGWTVSVRVGDHDLVEPYEMDAIQLERRRVPGVPAARRPAPEEPHADLCAGDTDAIKGLLDRIRRGRPASADVANYGRWLFECLLAPAWDAIRQQEDVVAGKAVEIALRWPAAAADLHRLVWEAMRDDTAPLASHVACAVAITRLVPAPPPRVQTITGVPKVLFASSVRVADPTIRPGAMFMGLLRGFETNGRCRARVVQGVTGDSLARACAEFGPDVVHLVAHGVRLPDGRSALMLRNDAGVPQEADATAMIAALTAGGTAPAAVILSACNTASAGESTDDPTDAAPLAAQLVAAGVPVVSAMAGEISEAACRLYTRRFAEALHAGKPIVTASTHGRRAALGDNAAPDRNIDWALPALFLAEDLDPARPLVDPSLANRLADRGNSLDLLREPLFIGRDEVLDAADRAVDPAAGIGVVAVLARTPTSRLGGTRLLREIGWRLLRDGHVPVLVGPYVPKSSPKTPRDLVYELVLQFVMVTEMLGLRPFVPVVLRDDLSPADETALVAAVDAAEPTRARSLVRKASIAFRQRPEPLHPDSVRDLLADDFATLAARARESGEPCGAHTTAVLLCDDVHNWAPPAVTASGPSALDCFLGMVGASGLGRPERPVPVVFTGSTTSDSGQQLNTWRAKSQPGFRVLELGLFAADEAVLGYQWILLHPWTTRSGELFGSVYTAGPAGPAAWEDTLRRVGTLPGDVEEELYKAIRYTVGLTCQRNDDEQAFRDYEKKYPEYRL
jgi:hypothetical protein